MSVSTPLPHSPADVLRTLLVQLGLGGDPAALPLPPWPVYVASEPGEPDQVLTCYDTAGRDLGRVMATGERVEMHGTQIRVRAGTHAEGWAKAHAVARALDEGVYDEPVTVGGVAYLVHSVSRTGTVFSAGRDAPASARRIFTVNVLVDLTVA